MKISIRIELEKDVRPPIAATSSRRQFPRDRIESFELEYSIKLDEIERADLPLLVAGALADRVRRVCAPAEVAKLIENSTNYLPPEVARRSSDG